MFTSSPGRWTACNSPDLPIAPIATGRWNSSARAVSKETLPNVVGMNLQKAQDTLQAAGFYYLDDQDATGQGRLQIFDRNWVVVRQTPAAGKRVTVDTKVVLYAKKHDE